MLNVFNDLWQRRSLIVLLAVNDIKLRYRNSVLGFFWTFLEPLLMLAVLYFVFSNIIKSDIENYPIYLLLGLIIWYMFSRATTTGLSSLVDRTSILQKIYFRREVVVVSSCLTAFIMMAFEFTVFGVFVAIFQFSLPFTAILLPLLLADVFILSLGISFILAPLNVYFRDIRFIWQVLLQAGFFLSPIIYELNMFSEDVQSILKINPMVSVLEIAHDLVLFDRFPSAESVIHVVVTTIILLCVGLFIFKIKEKRMIEEL